MARKYQTRTTIDIEDIIDWANSRGGRPAVAVSEDGEETELLRIDFGTEEEKLKDISWDEFARIFNEKDLAFIFQEEVMRGKKSRFFKLVDRDSQ